MATHIDDTPLHHMLYPLMAKVPGKRNIVSVTTLSWMRVKVKFPKCKIAFRLDCQGGRLSLIAQIELDTGQDENLNLSCQERVT